VNSAISACHPHFPDLDELFEEKQEDTLSHNKFKTPSDLQSEITTEEA
jgi:hypothetical protein